MADGDGKRREKEALDQRIRELERRGEELNDELRRLRARRDEVEELVAAEVRSSIKTLHVTICFIS